MHERYFKSHSDNNPFKNGELGRSISDAITGTINIKIFITMYQNANEASTNMRSSHYSKVSTCADFTVLYIF